MATYPEAMKAMRLLLDMAGEQYWRDRIQEDIQLWEAHHDAKYHLSAYGGMGSFNDVVITRRHGDTAVYRWNLVGGDPVSFVSAEGPLPYDP